MPMVNITVNLHSQTVKDALVYLKKVGHISSMSECVRQAVRDFLIKELGYIEMLEDFENAFSRKLQLEKEEEMKIRVEILAPVKVPTKILDPLGNNFHPNKDYTNKEALHLP